MDLSWDSSRRKLSGETFGRWKLAAIRTGGKSNWRHQTGGSLLKLAALQTLKLRQSIQYMPICLHNQKALYKIGDSVGDQRGNEIDVAVSGSLGSDQAFC
jgi:hypothetical protein